MIDRKELEVLLCELVNTKSPYYEEGEAMKLCYSWLSEAGFSPQLHRFSEPIAPNFDGQNIIVRYAPYAENNRICEDNKSFSSDNCKGNFDCNEKNSGKVIHLNGHLDTVPLCKGWTKDPYKAEITEDGRIYGLGVLDMKAGCVANMIALKAFDRYLKAEGKKFDGEIVLTLVSDEEGPFGLGANALIEENLIGEVDCSIITEPTAGFSKTQEFPLLCLGARGCYVYYVDFFGKSAHASQPETGLNAVIEAAKFIAQAENVVLPEREPLGAGSFCILKVEGDGGACSVPDFARVYIHRHITAGESEELVLAMTKEMIEKAGVKCEYRFGERPYPSEGSKFYQPYFVPRENEYARAFCDAIKTTCAKEANIGYFSSIGDFNYLGTRIKDRNGNPAPALIFGPDGAGMHGADEYVIMETVYQTAECVLEFLKRVYAV